MTAEVTPDALRKGERRFDDLFARESEHRDENARGSNSVVAALLRELGFTAEADAAFQDVVARVAVAEGRAEAIAWMNGVVYGLFVAQASGAERMRDAE